MPESDDITDSIIDAFFYLSPLRPQQIGPTGLFRGFIPQSEITAYCSTFPVMVSPDDFSKIIRVIDVKHLEYLNAEDVRQAEAAKKAGNKR